jgi:uncharacterized integral membrane protein
MRLLLLPLALLLVLFALSNAAPVQLGLWPTDFSLRLPLSIAMLLAMAAAFLLGGLFVWLSALGQRRRARRAEAQVRALDAQVSDLKARLMPAGSALPPPA